VHQRATLVELSQLDGCEPVVWPRPSRFARDLAVQETGWLRLRNQGVEVIAADSPHAFLDETPKAVFIQSGSGRGGAARQGDDGREAEGRARPQEGEGWQVRGAQEPRRGASQARPEAVALARRLACKRPNGGKLSLRAIAAALAAERHFNERGQPFHPMSVASMLAS